MAIEIERKYLVEQLDKSILPEGEAIDQGYLSETRPTVRIRTKGPRAFFTIKGSSDQLHSSGALMRTEFEYEVPIDDAKDILELALHRLQKTRHRLASGIEIDVFAGAHEGLILAEYESTDGSEIAPPAGVVWREVTSDRRYSNSWIARNGIPPLEDS